MLHAILFAVALRSYLLPVVLLLLQKYLTYRHLTSLAQIISSAPGCPNLRIYLRYGGPRLAVATGKYSHRLQYALT